MSDEVDAPRAVLVVEDDPGHAELIRRGLACSPGDVRVHHARDGVEALQLLRLRAGPNALEARPDLVLLDLRLPKLDGFEVLRAIKRSSLAWLPVVVLTTSENARDVIEAYALGVNSYLVKPVDFHALRELLRNIGAYWLGHNVVPRVDDEAASEPASRRGSSSS